MHTTHIYALTHICPFRYTSVCKNCIAYQMQTTVAVAAAEATEKSSIKRWLLLSVALQKANTRIKSKTPKRKKTFLKSKIPGKLQNMKAQQHNCTASMWLVSPYPKPICRYICVCVCVSMWILHMLNLIHQCSSAAKATIATTTTTLSTTIPFNVVRG